MKKIRNLYTSTPDSPFVISIAAGVAYGGAQHPPAEHYEPLFGYSPIHRYHG